MENLFLLIFGVLVLCLIVGLIGTKIFKRIFKERTNRKSALLSFRFYNYCALCCRDYVMDTRRASTDTSTAILTTNTYLHISPNPVQNGKALDIRYQFDNTTNGDISFEVFNMLGQKVLVSRSVGKNRQGGDKRLMLNLVPGIYLLKVDNGKEQQTARFIVNQ